MDNGQKKLLGHPAWHVVAVAALAALLVVCTAAVGLARAYFESSYGLKGSFLSLLFAPKLAESDMRYTAGLAGDGPGCELVITFDSSGADLSTTFDEAGVRQQADGSWRIGAADAVKAMLEAGATADGGKLDYSFGYTRTKDSVSRKGSVTGSIPLGVLDGMFVLQPETTMEGGRAYTVFKAPEAFAGWDITCDNTYVRGSAGGLKLDNDALLASIDLASAGAQVTVPLNFTLSCGGVDVLTLSRSVQLDTTPRLIDSMLEPTKETSKFDTVYTLRFNPIDRVQISINDPVVKKLDDLTFTVDAADVFAAHPGKEATLTYTVNVDFVFAGSVLKSTQVPLEFSRATPLTLVALPANCRDNNVVVTGTVLPGTVVKVNGKTGAALTENPDGTATFRYKLAVKQGSRAVAKVTASLPNFTASEKETSTMGIAPANVSILQDSTLDPGFTYVVATDPKFRVKVTYSFTVSGFGIYDQVAKHRISVLDTRSDPGAIDANGYVRNVMSFETDRYGNYAYGLYDLYVEVFNASGAPLFTKHIAVNFDRDAAMTADRKFAEDCKSVRIYDLHKKRNLVGKKVCFSAFVSGYEWYGNYYWGYYYEYSAKSTSPAVSYAFMRYYDYHASDMLNHYYHGSEVRIYGTVDGYDADGNPYITVYLVREE